MATATCVCTTVRCLGLGGDCVDFAFLRVRGTVGGIYRHKRRMMERRVEGAVFWRYMMHGMDRAREGSQRSAVELQNTIEIDRLLS